MTAAMFHTHKIVKRLKDAGARDADLSQLATKQDLQLREQRIMIKLGGMMVLAVGAVPALVRLL